MAVGIIADADKQTSVILAEAYGDSETIRGDGDAEAAKLTRWRSTKTKSSTRFTAACLPTGRHIRRERRHPT